jgi:uncharacterized membrane protein YphA (DoxX/SURF4 family)
MNLLHHLDARSESRTVYALLLLRCALGILLWFKGLSYISHTPELEALIGTSRFASQSHWIAGYVTWSHFFGGVMILLGLFTRFAIIVQLPVLIGAVFFVHAAHGVMTVDTQPVLSILVLILLIFYLVMGPGHHSMDWHIKRMLL